MADRDEFTAGLVPVLPSGGAGGLPLAAVEDLPAIVAAAGDGARFAWKEFFGGELPNAHTRAAYLRAVRRFLGWCEDRRVELHRITPGQVGGYLAGLPVSVPSRKQHLAGLRRFFDRLVVRHVVVLNPAASVRAERHRVVEGKTPEITVPTPEGCSRRSAARTW